MTRICRWGNCACGTTAAAADITGLESVEQQLGTRGYPRLRLGIGRRSDGRPGDYGLCPGPVRGRRSARTMEEVLDRAVRQVECWLAHGIEKAMNEFNGAVTAPADKGKQ